MTARSSHVRSAVHVDRDRGWGARLARDPVPETARRQGSEGGAPPTAQGWVPPSSVLLNDSEAARCVWLGISLALSLSDQVGGGEKKKEKDQISVPLNCPGFVQQTVIVRLAL